MSTTAIRVAETSPADRLRIALIASVRHPIRQPFAGGMEAQTWLLARELRRRGHEVALFAAGGSDPELAVETLPVRALSLSEAARTDVSMASDRWVAEHHAYLDLMLGLCADPPRFDVVHNNSLNYLPVAMAGRLPMPMITTLHTPPTPWLESALGLTRSPGTLVAVSNATARAWRHVAPHVSVVPNGIDLTSWSTGPGGDGAVWSGRFVPEKGPDLAIRAARLADMPLTLFGPLSDPDFFAAEVEPLLGGDVRYGGHLSHRELIGEVGRSAAALVTPRWEEPYGLVAAEALACGTPVAGFRRGGLPEVVGDQAAGVLVEPDDMTALAAALRSVSDLDRGCVRAYAERTGSAERMVDHYESLYRSMLLGAAA